MMQMVYGVDGGRRYDRISKMMQNTIFKDVPPALANLDMQAPGLRRALYVSFLGPLVFDCVDQNTVDKMTLSERSIMASLILGHEKVDTLSGRPYCWITTNATAVSTEWWPRGVRVDALAAGSPGLTLS